jgi:hypothetical protein
MNHLKCYQQFLFKQYFKGISKWYISIVLSIFEILTENVIIIDQSTLILSVCRRWCENTFVDRFTLLDRSGHNENVDGELNGGNLKR